MFHLTTAQSPNAIADVAPGDEGIDIDSGWDVLEEWLTEWPDEPEPWPERALCKQTDPDVFFPEKGGSTRDAKRICTGCHVRSECLDYALARDERFGVWGGLSARERRQLHGGDGSSESPILHPVGPAAPPAPPVSGRPPASRRRRTWPRS